MVLSLREKRLIGAAALLLLLLILYLLIPGEDAPPAAPALAPVAVSPPAPASAPASQPAPAPGAEISGLRLHGLLASGAILSFADGSQRLVPVGREAMPGLRLERIEQNQAVFASAGGEVRLGFDDAAQAGEQAAPAAPTARAPQQPDSLPYRLGLAPRRIGGRVQGFTVRPGADLPDLARAGIRPGDTILSVNGSVLDEERMLELPWQIANSTRLEFEIERGGRRLRLAPGGR